MDEIALNPNPLYIIKEPASRVLWWNIHAPGYEFFQT